MQRIAPVDEKFQTLFSDKSPVFKQLCKLKTEIWKNPKAGRYFERLQNSWGKYTNYQNIIGVMHQALQELDTITAGRISTCTHFLDLGCASGGFTRYMLEKGRVGTGLTLPVEKGGYPFKLDPNQNFTYTYDDITADPLHLKLACQPDLVISDIVYVHTGNESNDKWAFETQKTHLAQLLVALRHLKHGGNLLLKMSSRPHLFIMSIICALQHLFTTCHALKQKCSHGIRSSFYLFCQGFTGDPAFMRVLGNAWSRLTTSKKQLTSVCDTVDYTRYVDYLVKLLLPVWAVQYLALYERKNEFNK
jgi:23S rRNA U2552 (ribose-2'-O)-methylase RlmE/FtsJ